MDIDIVLDSHLKPQELTELGLLAEQHGIRTVWNASYLDGKDPFCNLVPLAMATSRIKIAPMALNGYELHPYRMTMSLLTLNEFAEGRVETMIGGGGEVVMSLDIPFEKRVRHVRECLEFVKGATTKRPFSYDGELFRIKDYNPQWPTAAPPFIYSAANRPQMLRMAAKAADGIFMSDLSPGLAKGAIEAVHNRMQEIGRDPTGFRFNNFMAMYVYDDLAEARHEARRWIGFRAIFREYMMREFMDADEFQQVLDHIPQIYAMAPKNESYVEGLDDELLERSVDNLTLTGTTDDLDGIIEHLLEYKALGMTEVCIELKKHQVKNIKLLGERILPAIQ
jgi:alkanesulfonate monooxygenase SsuD/methylene tetrahydromethanopterin reductase-like flavin-dependent oxidoreductase (luciferase family)